MSDLVSDLNTLINNTVRKALATVEARGGIAGKTSSKTYDGGSSSSSGGGIAGPLTEVLDADTKRAVREYHTTTSKIYSNDYLLAVEIKPLKVMTMKDATGSKIVFNFQLPPDQTTNTQSTS